MQKVIVIGCPGSGKSVFSAELAKIINLPLIHLDALYHRPDWPENELEKKSAWREFLTHLVQDKKWIIDGNYKSTLDIRIIAADTIIFLDYSRSLSIWRAVKRFWQFRNKKRFDMPDTWKEKIDWEFLRLIWTYRKEQRPVVLQMLDGNKNDKNIVILQNPHVTKKFLSSPQLRSVLRGKPL